MKQYLATTRGPWHSFLFALPLMVLYQLTVVLANFGNRRAVINGADAMVQNALSWVGVQGWIGAAVVVAIVGGVVAYRADPKHARQKPQLRYLLPLLLESSAYALLFGTLVSMLTMLVLPGGGLLAVGSGGLTFGQKLASGLGAGLYEELVFRLLLMGGFILLFKKCRLKEPNAVAAALLCSSFLFSLVHYVGPYADPLQLGSFTFRFIAGLVLAGLFAARGFAVAAWTHSLYDVFLLFARGE